MARCLHAVPLFSHSFYWANICMASFTSCFEVTNAVWALWSASDEVNMLFTGNRAHRFGAQATCLAFFGPTCSARFLQTQCRHKEWQLRQGGNRWPPLGAPVWKFQLRKMSVCVCVHCVTAKVLLNRCVLQSALTEIKYKRQKWPQKHTVTHTRTSESLCAYSRARYFAETSLTFKPGLLL